MKITFDFLQMDLVNAISFFIILVAACVQLAVWSEVWAEKTFHYIDRRMFPKTYNLKLNQHTVKLYDTLKFIAAPHVLEDKTHIAKTSEQCVAAARVAIAQFDDFKKGRK